MVTVQIQGVGSGLCVLTTREGEGLTVAFEGEPPQFLTWKGFKQLLTWKTTPRGNASPRAAEGEKKPA